MPATALYDIRSEKAPVAGTVRGGIAGVLVGVLLLVIVARRKDLAPKLFALGWIVLWAALTGWNARTITRAHAEAAEWLSKGDVKVTQGKVAGLSPATPDGALETFRIGDVPFTVDPAGRVPGLKRIQAEGGPIRDGRNLRVTYHGKSILLVEELP